MIRCVSETVLDNKLLLFTHRKLHTGFLLVALMTLNGMAVILRYFTKIGTFGDQLRHSGRSQTHTVCNVKVAQSH